MTGAPHAALLPDGKRLHLQHGPIDLVIGANGGAGEIARAYAQARERFEDILAALAGELTKLRQPVCDPRWQPTGPVACRMMEAVWPHRACFVTPMAAVAGAVADEMLAALVRGLGLSSAYVNNGGDIAIHLAPGESLTLGMVGDLHQPAVDGLARLRHDLPVRGVASSGWKGRSWSLGIADSVTVLARDAASADVAATLIANAVNVDHPAIGRRPANEVDDNTDLGARLVTVAVGGIGEASVDAALASGAAIADAMHRRGLIAGAALRLKGVTQSVGAPAAIAA